VDRKEKINVYSIWSFVEKSAGMHEDGYSRYFSLYVDKDK
jgi:hypothetical protein